MPEVDTVNEVDGELAGVSPADGAGEVVNVVDGVLAGEEEGSAATEAVTDKEVAGDMDKGMEVTEVVEDIKKKKLLFLHFVSVLFNFLLIFVKDEEIFFSVC